MWVTRGVRDDYERLQVAFYLPDNNLEGIAWAVANFDPSLSVTINGVSEEGSREMIEAAKRIPAEGTLVGRWRDPEPMMGGIITITEKNGKLYLHQRFQYDGSELEKELAEVPWQGEGRRLQWADNPDTRDYYVLHPDGRLDIYIARKLESTVPRLDK